MGQVLAVDPCPGNGDSPPNPRELLLDQIWEQIPIPQLPNSTVLDPRLFFLLFPTQYYPKKTPEAEPGGSTLPLFSLWGPPEGPGIGKGQEKGGEATAAVTIPPLEGGSGGAAAAASPGYSLGMKEKTG